mmetsp:Transcript_19912/g.25647  ORF Transcript_19912/g.25647 Transcript_19912/m.25647 type:complete len:233 (-) Transcript_19912:153-851(-)|eukprot:CAMPEP_0198152830 /NCGR_PEP_ID=MMETSP1443-20131203/61505_1 /TAXON_ID=186043 /ORGANISM="Entomoneis sp., Strain CCMP2396" /LENGTH=232 /DNA_ID=CAMNT_0043818963 /DNA_START=133 /DNA_END=831 /DNA_ORIENTATION=+
MGKTKKKATATAVTAQVDSRSNNGATKVSQTQTQTPLAVKEVGFAAERVFLLGAILLLIGTAGFYNIPGMVVLDDDEKSKRNHLVDSFYCAAITLTTVGFGDICPGETIFFGKIFLVLFSLSGLGIFCGPIMDLASSWRYQIPGGIPTLASFTLGVGVLVFTTFEGLDQTDAIYASVITGTTIGYGDKAPSTNMGKIAVALYAIASVNAMACILAPACQYMEAFCKAKVKTD